MWALAFLFVLCSSLHNAVCISSDCVGGLPQSVDELVSIVENTPLSSLTRQAGQARIFPSITFNCSGSIVGWSVITADKSMTGGRPVIHTWNSSDGETFQQSINNSRLLPCVKKVIMNNQLYLIENITEKPLEFQSEDVLGMLLRNVKRSAFQPYFMAREDFVAYYRTANNHRMTENVNAFMKDDMMPLLFLHVCSKDEDNYEACMEENSRAPTTCINMLESSPTTNEDGDGMANTILIISVAVPLGLILLVVMTVLVLTLVCVGVSRRRRRRVEHKRNGVSIVTENANIAIGDAQPYAEPSLIHSPLPSSRAHTPLPPPPTHPPPPPGLSVQPTYAVLDGPAPSPPPPYVLNLEYTNRPPPLNSLPSPEYESIDKKVVLQRQDAKDTRMEGADYAEPQQSN